MEIEWEMPSVQVGQPIYYYPGGVIAKSRRIFAFVTQVGRRNIALSFQGAGRDAIRHKDDPELLTKPHAVGAGVWDFTEYDIARERRISELSDRVSKLESLLKQATK